MKTNHVWIIEMLENGKWVPCAAAHLARFEATNDLHNWIMDNPHDRFRAVKYVSTRARAATGGASK